MCVRGGNNFTFKILNGGLAGDYFIIKKSVRGFTPLCYQRELYLLIILVLGGGSFLYDG